MAKRPMRGPHGGPMLAGKGKVNTKALGRLIKMLFKNYPAMLCGRYKLDGIPEELKPYQIVELIGKKRGFLMSGGEINTERTANMLLDEFRSGKIGRITLDII